MDKPKGKYPEFESGRTYKIGDRVTWLGTLWEYIATGKWTGPMDEPEGRLPTQAAARKAVPLVAGCLDYFPDALAAVAALSMIGNEQHNKGQPMHWARSKSGDEAECILRHLVDRGTIDTDGVRHSVKVAWRALALLQKELEAVNGLPISRGSWE